MDLLARGTCVPAVTARGAIVEKGLKRCKAIGDYLNNRQFSPQPKTLWEQACSRLGFTFNNDAECNSAFASTLAPTFGSFSTQDFLAAGLVLAPRWRWASNRQTPVATDTLRLLTLPAIGSFTR